MGSNQRNGWAAIAATLALIAGCNGHVVTGNGAGGDGGSEAGGSSAGGGDTGSVTSTTTTTTTTTTVCVEQPVDPGEVPMQTCAQLDPLIVNNPVLTDTNGDGSLSPGETGTLAVDLVETSGIGMYWYPFVAFTSDTPSVTVTSGDFLYGIGPCGTYTLTTQITVDAAVPKGTTVNVLAKVSALNLECPGSFTLTVPVTIQ